MEEKDGQDDEWREGEKVPSPLSYKVLEIKIRNQAPKNLVLYKLKMPQFYISATFQDKYKIHTLFYTASRPCSMWMEGHGVDPFS